MNSDSQDTANLWLQFARKAEEIANEHQSHLQKTKQRFNIFKALRVDRYEVPTSNFICYLLDPREKHDCGYLFLQCFIQTLISIPPLAKNDQTCALHRLQVFEREPCQGVRTEVSTDQGRRIDIVAHFESATLAIENKIGAGDQNEQLLDYSNYLQTQSKQVLLLYLTPHGAKSTSDGGCDYHRISYRDHILHWLRLCITELSEYPRVKESIEQFRDMIQTVVNPAYPNPKMNLLTDFVRQNPVILKQRDMISEAITLAQMEIIQDFYRRLNRRIKETTRDRLELKPGKSPVCTPTELNYHFVNGSRQIDDELSSYQLMLEQDNAPPSLALGIRAPFEEPATTQPEHTDKLRRLGAFLKESHPNFHHDFGEWWPAGWGVLVKDPFTPEKCADSLLMDEMVELVTEKIICYVDVVEKWLEKTSS